MKKLAVIPNIGLLLGKSNAKGIIKKRTPSNRFCTYPIIRNQVPLFPPDIHIPEAIISNRTYKEYEFVVDGSVIE